jgi:hypothetical protein
MLAALPVRILNPIRAQKGIPPDSVIPGTALALHTFWLQIRHTFSEFPPRRRARDRNLGYGRKPCAIIHWAAYASLDGPGEFVLACPCCWQFVWTSSHCGDGPEALAQLASVSASSSKVTHLVARIDPHRLPRAAIGRRMSDHGRLTERRGTIMESAPTCASDIS